MLAKSLLRRVTVVSTLSEGWPNIPMHRTISQLRWLPSRDLAR